MITKTLQYSGGDFSTAEQMTAFLIQSASGTGLTNDITINFAQNQQFGTADYYDLGTIAVNGHSITLQTNPTGITKNNLAMFKSELVLMDNSSVDGGKLIYKSLKISKRAEMIEIGSGANIALIVENNIIYTNSTYWNGKFLYSNSAGGSATNKNKFINNSVFAWGAGTTEDSSLLYMTNGGANWIVANNIVGYFVGQKSFLEIGFGVAGVITNNSIYQYGGTAVNTFSNKGTNFTSGTNFGLTDTILANTTDGITVVSGRDVYPTSGSSILSKANDLYLVSPDAVGITRPQGVSGDLGAFEFDQRIALTTPTISPTSGGFNNSTTITISGCAATYYTLNGSTPSSSSTLYTVPFTLNVNTTAIKAITILAGSLDSAVATAGPFNFTVADLTINPSRGSYSNATTVTISGTTVGESIYYTVDGSAPTSASTLYSVPIALNGTVATLRTIGVKTGYTNSSVVSGGAYTFTVATPTLSPVSGAFNNAVTLTFTDGIGAEDLYYTTDGTYPTTASNHYTAPFAIDGVPKVRMVGIRAGYDNSTEVSGTYTWQVATPALTSGGSFAIPVQINASTDTVGATLYYLSVTGTPTSGSTVYTVPLIKTATGVFSVVGYKTKYTPSAVVSGTYTIGTLPSGDIYLQNVVSGKIIKLFCVNQNGSDQYIGGTDQDGVFQSKRWNMASTFPVISH